MDDSLSLYLRFHGPQSPRQIALRYGVCLPAEATLDQCIDRVADLGEDVTGSLSLVYPLVDGRLAHALHILDGIVLTHRATARTHGRRDIWASPSIRTLLDLTEESPLALAGGGRCERSPSWGAALIGPEGWLPEVEPGELLGFRLTGEVLSVEKVTEIVDDEPTVRRVRGNLARKTRYDADGQHHVDLTICLVTGRLEDPDLLRAPMAPLDELLYEPVDYRRPELFRELMAWRQDESVSFTIEGMPEGLHSELSGRAQHYGMSFDAFVIAVLGHLAWRTPFAEDMGPWEGWVTDPGIIPAVLRSV